MTGCLRVAGCGLRVANLPAPPPCAKLTAVRRFVAPFVAAALAAVVAACASPAPTTSSTPTPTPSATTKLRVLATSDEHGWLFPLKDKRGGLRRGGVLEAAEALRAEGLGRDDVLLISTGDMWTGPYESTLLRGAPMLEAMAAMGYAAAVVGNHEFDFGQDVLLERSRQAPFPFLAANVVDEKTGEVPPFARAFAIVERAGRKIGVVGLTTTETPSTTDVKNLKGLRFLPYAEALGRAIPAARAAGAELLVVAMHEGPDGARAVVDDARRYGAHVVLFGHVHKPALFVDEGAPGPADDVVLCNGGPYLRTYCRVDVELRGAALVSHDARIGRIERPLEAAVAADAQLGDILARASAAAEQQGGEVLVDAPRTLERRGPVLGRFVVESWLKSFPDAAGAITNRGGLRQDLPAGPVRVRDVVSVMPFDNTLVVVDMAVPDLVEALGNEETIAAGLALKQGAVVDARGAPLPADARVKVVVSDFLYRGGDRFRFAAYDPDPVETGIDWREPVLQELRRMRAAGLKLE